MTPVFARAAALLVSTLAAGAPLAADTAPIPIEQFFGKPSMTGALISPNGRYVVMRELSPLGRVMLTVIDNESRAQKVVANYRNADVSLFYWLSDQRLAYTLINVDHDGDVGKPGLYAADRDGKDPTPLSEVLPGKRAFADSESASSTYLPNVTVAGFPYRNSEAVFVIQRWEQDSTLARVDSRTGRITNIKAPRDTFRWLRDPQGEVRVATALRDGKHVVLFKDDGQWRELASFKPSAPEAFRPLLYADGVLYVRSYKGRNESAVYRYDLQTKTMADQPTVSVPDFDADGYFLLDDKKTLGFRIDTDSETTWWFDPTMKAIQAEVDALLPGTVNTVSYGAHSETPYVLIDSHADVQDHDYILYQRESKKLLRLGTARPGLDIDRMARMSMVRYPARDGLRIPAYVTLPAAPPKQPLPTVVLVGEHPDKRNGGWEWDAEVQFLASRGYVVLQPAPRGTAGFGRAHRAAGNGQEGLAIQNDIADAVKWAAAQGYTDPARVCIAGTGYGGYAAMMSLIRDPALFKCGVSWSGITESASESAAVSPLRSAARITQPVLLAYGEEDGRVPFKDGLKFRDAVAAGNPAVEWLAYKPSVEDWKTQGNRIDLWRHIEAFLARNIGK
jgi:dipeptidyl aminopeptidase/acylaminoacyl peptidase